MRLARRARGLARRYGHSAMTAVHGFTADIRKLATDNKLATAGLVGAAAGAITTGLGVGAAALVGAVSGIAIEEVTHKK